jgi:putative flavoprotein involved in K+ transport
MIQLPGAEYQGDDPDGFMMRDDVVNYFENYVTQYDMPIRFRVHVTSVEPSDMGYKVQTDKTDFHATNVVIATGLFQQARIPPFSTNLPTEICQLHSSEYRKPEVLPDGAVFVVGSAQSGCQIAEELYQSRRKVYLSVGSAGRLPRRYRGKDITWWLEEIGFFNQTVDKLPSRKAKFAGSAHGTGRDGGHTINLHQFARDGVTLLGHIQSVKRSSIVLAPDLHENLTKSDQAEANVVKQVDGYIEKMGLTVPQETLPTLRDGFNSELISELGLKTEGITSVIWATGYSFDFNLVKLPVFDEDGFPVQKRGVTQYPGLYFIGLPWLHTVKSGLLAGVGEDAAHVASVIARR